MGNPKSGLYEQIYETVKRVPAGRVATYGQIARVAGIGQQARLVGYALRNLPEGSRVPWHRVINAQGRIKPGLPGRRARHPAPVAGGGGRGIQLHRQDQP